MSERYGRGESGRRSSAMTVSLLLSAAASLAASDAVHAEDRGKSRAGDDETCVGVEIGGTRTPDLDCINRRLKRKVDRVEPQRNEAPLDAASPAERVGGFNETAVGQQYGKNFGRSATPFRPTPQPAPPLGTK